MHSHCRIIINNDIAILVIDRALQMVPSTRAWNYSLDCKEGHIKKNSLYVCVRVKDQRSKNTIINKPFNAEISAKRKFLTWNSRPMRCGSLRNPANHILGMWPYQPIRFLGPMISSRRVGLDRNFAQ